MSWRIFGLAVAIGVALLAWHALRSRDASGGDLKGELAELAKDLRGRVDPLPRVSAAPAAAYGAANLPDPFYPVRKP